jgi:hypothetical protein
MARGSGRVALRHLSAPLPAVAILIAIKRTVFGVETRTRAAKHRLRILTVIDARRNVAHRDEH